MKKLTIILLGILIAATVNSQDAVVPEMITDRPDQTESAAIVPKGHFQVETGFIFQGDEANNVKSNEIALFTTLFRYGINHNFELRLGSGFLDLTDKPEGGEDMNISGLAPLFAGIKFKMLEENGAVPEMAFLVTTEIPGTGKDEFTPEYVAADMRFAVEYTLTDRLGFGMNIGGRWNGTEPDPGGIYSFVFGYGLLDNFGIFLESYGILPSAQLPDHRLDAGFTWSLKNNLQVDASGGIGLSEVSPDYFINAGLSWRIPK